MVLNNFLAVSLPSGLPFVVSKANLVFLPCTFRLHLRPWPAILRLFGQLCAWPAGILSARTCPPPPGWPTPDFQSWAKCLGGGSTRTTLVQKQGAVGVGTSALRGLRNRPFGGMHRSGAPRHLRPFHCVPSTPPSTAPPGARAVREPCGWWAVVGVRPPHRAFPSSPAWGPGAQAPSLTPTVRASVLPPTHGPTGSIRSLGWQSSKEECRGVREVIQFAWKKSPRPVFGAAARVLLKQQ